MRRFQLRHAWRLRPRRAELVRQASFERRLCLGQARLPAGSSDDACRDLYQSLRSRDSNAVIDELGTSGELGAHGLQGDSRIERVARVMGPDDFRQGGHQVVTLARLEETGTEGQDRGTRRREERGSVIRPYTHRTAMSPSSRPSRPPSASASESRSAAVSRCAAHGRGRRCVGCGSTTTPPPSVPIGDPPRITNRSPPRATIGASRTTRAALVSPASNGPPAVTTRAPTSVVARWNRTLARGDSAVVPPSASKETSARSTRVGCQPCSATSTAPRATSS